MRKQYAALALVFLGMMTFNLTATHRASRVAADLASLEDERMHAEAVIHEFQTVTMQLNALKSKAELMEHTDSKIDVAAVLAEMSYLVDERVVLNRIDVVAKPYAQWRRMHGAQPEMLRPAQPPQRKDVGVAEDAVFEILLTGVASHASRVADLVCRLEESPYFRRVYPSFSRNAKVPFGGETASKVRAGGRGATAANTFEVTEFEISCYLANFEDVEQK
jgi:hypothetical protein